MLTAGIFHNTIMWSPLINAYCSAGLVEKVILFFEIILIAVVHANVVLQVATLYFIHVERIANMSRSSVYTIFGNEGKLIVS